jgi:hypothetical protein
MSTAPVAAGVRQVLAAPRGQRFTRTPALSPTRVRPPSRPDAHQEQHLTQMRDNPRVAYRLDHGELPAWMRAQAERQRVPRPTPDTAPRPVPRPRPAPDDGPPPSRPSPKPRPLPRRPRSHRKPRHAGWRLTGYALAAVAGAAIHHLTSVLL